MIESAPQQTKAHIFPVFTRSDRQKTNTQIFSPDPRRHYEQTQKQVSGARRTPFILIKKEQQVPPPQISLHIFDKKPQPQLKSSVDTYCGTQNIQVSSRASDNREIANSFDPEQRYEKNTFIYGNQCNSYHLNSNDYRLMMSRPVINKQRLETIQEHYLPQPILNLPHTNILEPDALRGTRNRVYNGFTLPTQKVYVHREDQDKNSFRDETQVSSKSIIMEHSEIITVPPNMTSNEEVPHPSGPTYINYKDRKQGLFQK